MSSEGKNALFLHTSSDQQEVLGSTWPLRAPRLPVDSTEVEARVSFAAAIVEHAAACTTPNASAAQLGDTANLSGFIQQSFRRQQDIMYSHRYGFCILFWLSALLLARLPKAKCMSVRWIYFDTRCD